MEKCKLKLDARKNCKPNQLRAAGVVPATLYGPGTESVSLQVCATEFSRLPVSAFSSVLELDAPEGKVPALIRQVQRKHVSGEVLNVEFLRVAKDRLLTVIVPLNFVGISSGLAKGGQLVQLYKECELQCLPGDIPGVVEVDISLITEVDGAIHFSDLKVPDAVKIINPPKEIVCRSQPKRGSGGDKK